jgi:membrane protease YdiL (CAAX protease family)
MEGAHGAYFVNVGYPATAYAGENSSLSFVVYNKNCSANGMGYANFYLVFYVDGDVWWNEYNNTDYKTWKCSVGSSVALSYSLSSWDTAMPVAHDMMIELYSYNGNASQLQDVASFSVSVAVHAGLGSLIISGYVFLFLIALFFLGFYVLTGGPIEIFSSPQNVASVSGEQPVRTVSFLSKLLSLPFLCFYLFVLASWQMIGVLFYAFSFPGGLQSAVYFAVEIAYIVVLVSLIKRENSSFGGYGFLWPEETLKYVAVSLLLAVFYSFIIIVLPGIYAGYDAFPSASIMGSLSIILLSLVASFTVEAIFRGYIQSKLTKLSGFPQALIATSVMFALFTVHFLPFDFSSILFEVLSLFIMGFFIGVLFYRTKTLLCPVIFYFGLSIISSLVPVRAVSSEYLSLFFECVALAISYLLLNVLVLNKLASEDDLFFEEL